MTEPQHPGPKPPQPQPPDPARALPPRMPDSWLDQIVKAQSQILPPQIPDSWLIKIKEATKPNLLATILGSSFIAALIAMGSAALTAHMANRGAERLERVKLQLQEQGDQLKNRIQAYNTLAHDLNSLASDLDAYLRMIEIAAKGPRSPFSADDLDAQRKKVGQSEKEVLSAQQQVAQFDSALSGEIDPCLQDLSPALAKQAREAESSLRNALTRLKQLVFLVNQELNKTVAKSTFG